VRTLLPRPAVFADGWILEAAEAICADAESDPTGGPLRRERSAGAEGDDALRTERHRQPFQTTRDEQRQAHPATSPGGSCGPPSSGRAPGWGPRRSYAKVQAV